MGVKAVPLLAALARRSRKQKVSRTLTGTNKNGITKHKRFEKLVKGGREHRRQGDSVGNTGTLGSFDHFAALWQGPNGLICMLPGYRMYRPLNSLPEVINTLKNDFFLTSLLLEILFRKVKDVLNGVHIGTPRRGGGVHLLKTELFPEGNKTDLWQQNKKLYAEMWLF